MQLDRKAIAFRDVKLAADAENTGVFEGYGSVFGNVDSYGDVVQRGAFKKTLTTWKAKGQLPPMLLQHGGFMNADDMVPIGQWTDMKEDAYGLKAKGKLFALGTERGQYLYENLKAGTMDGLSIGFRAVGVTYGDGKDEPDRTITEIDLWELSVVTFPANPKTRIVGGVKSMSGDEFRLYEAALREAGLTKRHAQIACARLRSHYEERRREAGVTDRREAEHDTGSEARIAALAGRLTKQAPADDVAKISTLAARVAALMRS